LKKCISNQVKIGITLHQQDMQQTMNQVMNQIFPPVQRISLSETSSEGYEEIPDENDEILDTIKEDPGSFFDHLLIVTTHSTIYLLDSNLKVLDQRNWDEIVFHPVASPFYRMRRISFIEYIPEWSCLVFCNSGYPQVVIMRIFQDGSKYELFPETTIETDGTAVLGSSLRKVTSYRRSSRYHLHVLTHSRVLYRFELSLASTMNAKIDHILV
jgi:hypothetical protein